MPTGSVNACAGKGSSRAASPSRSATPTSPLPTSFERGTSTSTTRTRALPEPTDHSPAVAATALGLLTSLGLQRARVRAFVLRADDLRPAGSAYRQLSMDPTDARARAVEAAADRARRRFGQEAVRPATLAD